MQYRLSTLLLAFVVVWSSLAVFGMGGLAVAAVLLVIAVPVRNPKLRQYVPMVLVVILGGFGLFWLLSPSVTDCRLPSGRAGCLNNLHQIALALLDYEQQSGGLPPAAVADGHGHAVHSWRTLILPYLDRSDIYRAYNFREPWNGPDNSKVAASMPGVFRCEDDLSISDRPITSYLAVTGPGTAWDDCPSAGTPPRVMLVEVANSKINWMEPRDLTLDEACRGAGNGSGPSITSHHVISSGFFFQEEADGVNVAFSDGHIEILRAGVPPETLRGRFTGDEKRGGSVPGIRARLPVADPLDELHRAGGAHHLLRGAVVSAAGKQLAGGGSWEGRATGSRLTNLSYRGTIPRMAEILVTPQAQRQLDRLPRTIRARVHVLVRRLQRWPEVSGAKPLTGKLAGRFRLRTGDYRLQFDAHGKAIVIERIGHRAGFYED